MARRIDNSERRSVFPRDDALRRAGWIIKSRPRFGEDVWILRDGRGRVLMTATADEAIEYLEAAKDKYAEFVK